MTSPETDRDKLPGKAFPGQFIEWVLLRLLNRFEWGNPEAIGGRPAASTDELIGDLIEEARVEVLPNHGRTLAQVWILKEAIRSLPHRRRVRGRRWVGWLERQVADLRYSLRALTKHPRFTLTAIFTLAIGTGATTTVFSLANWALLRPLPGVESPDELIKVRAFSETREGALPFSYPIVRKFFEEEIAGLESVTAYLPAAIEVQTSEISAPAQIQAQIVTPGFFKTLGVQMQRGRAFSPEEADQDAVHYVAVVSHSYWRDHLDTDPDVLGRSITVSGSRFQVVGVTQPEFEGTERTSETQIWFPVSAVSKVLSRVPPNILRMDQAFIFADLIGRIVPGVSGDEVAGRLQASAPELDLLEARVTVSPGVGLSPGLQERVSGMLVVLSGLVALLLLLTMANLTNLVLSRLSGRRAETVLRKALGASPGRLLSGLMSEAYLLSAGGVVVALFATWLALQALDGSQWIQWFPAIEGVPVDRRVLIFSLLTGVGVTLGATFMTTGALQRFAPAGVLRVTAGRSGSGRLMRKGLVSFQVALSLSILIAAGLLVRSLDQLSELDLGFVPEGVVAFSLSPGTAGMQAAQADILFRELIVELDELPGVASAGFSWLGPLELRQFFEEVTPTDGTGEAEMLTAQANMISPGFVEAMGMRVIAGRTFTDEEYLDSVRPDRGDVVINRTLAEILYPNGDAVGRELRMPNRTESAFKIIGVVEDTRFGSVREPTGAYLFDPFGNGYRTSTATYVVRSTEDPEVMLSRIRELIRTRNPELTVLGATTLSAQVQGTLVEERMMARLASIFAALAMILAAVGLYGLISEAVQARVREFGVRTALGAQPYQVISLILREGLVLVMIGSVIGMVTASQMGRLLESRLFGIGATDPVTFVTAAGVLCAVAVLAMLGPALRSSKIDPAGALRSD